MALCGVLLPSHGQLLLAGEAHQQPQLKAKVMIKLTLYDPLGCMPLNGS
jgi:hypothetical protein